MKKINSAKYEVATGETVTIKVTPKNGVTGNTVEAVLDDDPFNPQPGTAATAPTFIFKASKPVGKTHFVEMEFDFPGAPSNAEYDVAITGSAGGDTGGFVIDQQTGVKDPEIRFKVVS